MKISKLKQEKHNLIERRKQIQNEVEEITIKARSEAWRLREEEFSKQRIKRGFDESELWNLYITISKFIFPRLKQFIKHYPYNDNEQFLKDAKKFLKTLKKLNSGEILDEKDIEKVKKGLKKFHKIFLNLYS